MPPPHRRKSDRAEARPFWHDMPHMYLYPALGFLIGLCTPAGAFLLRTWQVGPLFNPIDELQSNFVFYGVMAAGTISSLLIFGYILGLRSDAQRVRNRTLRARLEELHLKSVTDALTGTYTHGYMHEILEIEVQHALTTRAPLSVLLIDIDDFKKLNDLHGHLFGDRAIKETAETIAASVRSDDIIGRLGGDEFVVVMPAAGHDTAAAVARRICAACAKGGPMATVSVGTTSLHGHDKVSAQDLLHAADMHLYRAKREGKNRVCAEAKQA